MARSGGFATTRDAFPFVERDAQRGKELHVGIVPQDRPSHFPEQFRTVEAAVQVSHHLAAHVVDVQRLDGMDDLIRSGGRVRRVRRVAGQRLVQGPQRYVDPPVVEDLPGSVEQALCRRRGSAVRVDVTQGSRQVELVRQGAPAGVDVHGRARHAVRREQHEGRDEAFDGHAVPQGLRHGPEGPLDVDAQQGVDEGVLVVLRAGIGRVVMRFKAGGDLPQQPDGVPVKALRLVPSPAGHLGAQVAHQLGRLAPPEGIHHPGEVAQAGHVTGKTEEVRRHGTFEQQLEDLVFVAVFASRVQTPFDPEVLHVAGEHAHPAVDLLPGDRRGQRNDLEPLRRPSRRRPAGQRQRHQPVLAVVSSADLEPGDQERNDIAAAARVPLRRDVPAQVPQDQLDDVVFRYASGEQQRRSLGDRPGVAAQQALPKQLQVLVPPPVGRVAGLNPQFVSTDFDGKGLQVVAFVVEASAALEIEAAAVPVAGQDTVLHHAAGQRKPHVGTLVVGGVYTAFHVEEGDAPALADFDGAGFSGRHVREGSRPDPAVT